MANSIPLTKSASSPCSADKFPPTLLRIMRSNTGSRSAKGRPPRSPMFSLRASKRSLSEINQEPSSPKVTCIGQVRVRRRRKRRRRRRRRRKGRLRWFRRQQMKISLIFWNFVRSFRFGCWNCGRPNENKKDSVGEGNDDDVNGNHIGRINTEFDLDESSPPKNALILMRCRTVPQISSSWAPLPHQQEEEEGNSNAEPEIRAKSEECPTPTCNAIIDPEINAEMNKNSGQIEEEEEEEGKVLLQRSKSMPERRAERLDIKHSNSF